MARKHLGNGTVASAATETTIYQPSASNLIATVGSLTFFNSSTSSQATVTVYGPHSGAAATADIIDEFTINPRKSYICRPAINKVIANSAILSCQCDVGSNVLVYSADGDES